jgi:hypothetical protein
MKRTIVEMQSASKVVDPDPGKTKRPLRKRKKFKKDVKMFSTAGCLPEGGL